MNDKIGALSKLLADRVLPMFRDSDVARHPWWWPLNYGGAQADWLPGVADGLVEDRSGMPRGQLLRSLRDGTGSAKARQRVDPLPWSGFAGFFGLGPSPGTAIVSITEAPGTGPYPAAPIATMMRRLDELGLRSAHFTNLIKRRGGAPGIEGTAAHLDLLVEELVIVGSGAARLLLCPNRVLARESDAILTGVRGEVATRLPSTDVVLLRGDDAPLALYSGFPQDPGEVLASWRSVLRR